MALQTPLVLISGAFSTLPPGDTIPASDPVAQASGNAALVLAGTALASGNAGISTGLTALASGNAGISTGLTALASGNAGLVSASNKVPISGGFMTGQLFAASGVVVSGTLTVGINSVAAPSLVFNGSPTTGIFSPGGNQLAVSTNGVERVEFGTSEAVFNDGGTDYDFRVEGDTNAYLLFVDASTDRVGIGNSSPQSLLHIVDSSATTTTPLKMRNYASSVNSKIRLSFEGVTSSGQGANAFIQSLAGTDAGGSNSNNDSGLQFIVTNGGSSTENQAMIINTLGRVGINTNAPAFPLHISTGDTSSISEPTAGTFGLYIQQNSSGSKGGLCIQDGASNSGPALKVVDNGNNARFIIDGDGNVGIGDPTPSYLLELSTDSAAKPSTNTWTIASDERIKEDIELADLDLCYQAVKNIPLKRFKWRDEIYTEKQVKDRRKLGWIAQDVEAVFPKAVGSREFKYNQVFEERLIPAVEEVLDDEGNVTTPAQPEHIKQELISEDVIEDCRDLNSDQLYAAMYGAIQKLMVKVENLESISGIDGVK